jgi:hypothetical protein
VGADKETRLRRAVDVAQQKLDDLANARDQAVKAAMQAWDKKYGRDLHAAKEKAIDQLRRFCVAQSRKKNRAIIGRQVVEWRYDFNWRSYCPTGRRGVVEVWDDQKVKGEGKHISFGRLVVREIKRGKLSVVVDLYCQDWIPAGVRHKDANPSVDKSAYAAVNVQVANKKACPNDGRKTAKSR